MGVGTSKFNILVGLSAQPLFSSNYLVYKVKSCLWLQSIGLGRFNWLEKVGTLGASTIFKIASKYVSNWVSKVYESRLNVIGEKKPSALSVPALHI